MKRLTLIRESRRPLNIRKLLEKSYFAQEIEGKATVGVIVSLISFRGKYEMANVEAVAELTRFIKEISPATRVIVAAASHEAYSEGKSTEEAFKRLKYALVKREGAELFPLEAGEYSEVEFETTKGLKRARLSKFRADLLVSFTPPKTHPIFVISATLDNLAFEMTNPADRHYLYGGKLWPEDPLPYFKLASKNILKVFSIVKPHVGIVDGLFAVEGRGPLQGTPVFHQLALASPDLVLVDALATALAGVDPEKVYYLRLAREMNLGSTDYFKTIPKERIRQYRFPYRLHPASQVLLQGGSK